MAVPRIDAVEDSTLRCNDSSIAWTADAQAKVVLDPSLVESGKAIGAGNYHDKHGEYDEWTAVSAPEGYRLSRMTRTVSASDELDPFADVGYRYFVATDCTLTFDANGGVGDMSAYNLPQGSEEVWADLPYTIPKCTFTYGTHKFKAWNTKPDGSGVPYLPGKSVFIFKTLDRKDVTLYAIYEGTQATVTFDYGGESGLSRQRVWVGDKVDQPEDPQRDHYDFGGWYTDAACTDGNEFDFDTAIEGDLTLYAKWKNFSSHHNWVEESREGEVSCVSGMKITYRCTVCNETWVKTIPPDLSIHHTEDLLNQPGQNPTCTENGYYFDLIRKCKDCGYVLYRSWTTLSKTGHTWGEWVVIKDSTEDVAGVQQHTCTKCGATEERPYPTKLHDHTFMKIEEEQSTCECQGHKEYWYCAGCGEWFLWHNDHYREIGPDDNVVYPLADHIPGYPVTENVVEPTCGKDGSHDKVVKCSVCNQELSRTTEVDPATGKHTPGEVKRENETASTCSAHGSHDEVTYCAVCKQELSRNRVDDELLAHTPGDPVRENVMDPSVTDDGWYDEVVYCTVCKHELSRKEVVLPAHGASYSVVEGDKAEWSSDDDGGLTLVFKRSKDDETTFDHFLGVRIDHAEELLDPLCYEAEKGSVIITFAPDYLDTLEIGEHTVTVLFDDGDEVNASFTILEPKSYDEEDDPVDPKEEEKGDPVQPDEEGKGDPVQPKEEGAGDPVQPEGANASATKPASAASAGAKTAPNTGDGQRFGTLLLVSAFASVAMACVALRKKRDS